MTDLTPQKPAQGIMLDYDYKSSKSFRVPCDCNEPDHTQDIWVEADTGTVVVTLFTTQDTVSNKVSRWRAIWKLLTTGRIEYHVETVLTEQQALNYCEALRNAIEECKTYRIS